MIGDIAGLIAAVAFVALVGLLAVPLLKLGRVFDEARESIKELTEHLKVNKKDFAARRGLLQLVGKRKRLLQYIAAEDGEKYLALIKKLGIRR